MCVYRVFGGRFFTEILADARYMGCGKFGAGGFESAVFGLASSGTGSFIRGVVSGELYIYIELY